ncbi:MAG: hypothetical protein ACD_37C00277G0002 [uncultured bacterium]|nr:MAG: hypothetical protein ACD_37C00277G0002 [uncultured bacterium]OGH43501.1 MAG: hypothetical protein A3I49_00330 [Candidatus Levybacteria bacterium RIFCSPLOWO2_02_FULL_37_11]
MEQREQPQSEEIDFSPDSVAITATTLYRGWYEGDPRDVSDTDKIRGDLALHTIDLALAKGYRVVVADGPSSQEFKEELARRNILLVPRASEERSEARRQLIEKSSSIPGVKVIIRTEPEKASLVESCIPQLVLPILKGEADIVVPKRNPSLFEQTYPNYMHSSEVQANRRYNRILREFGFIPDGMTDLDFFFGPAVLKNDPQIIELFLKKYKLHLKRETTIGVRKYISPDDFSNSQIFAVVEAMSKGVRVKSVEIPFVYPDAQRENEMIDYQGFSEKRKKQKWGILDELVLFIRYLNDPNDPKNIISKVS